MKRYLIAFFVLVISISGVYPIFALEKQKIPADFFMGKWGGTIKGERGDIPAWYSGFGEGYVTGKYGYSMKILYLIPVPDEEMYEITPEMKGIIENLKKQLGDKFPQQSEFKYKGWAEIILNQEEYHSTLPLLVQKRVLYNFIAEVPIEVTLNLENENSFYFDILSDEEVIRSKLWARSPDEEDRPYEGYAPIKSFVDPQGGKFSVEKNNKIIINDETETGVMGDDWLYLKITGELHRIYVKKDTLGKTIHLNEPIITDKFTQRDIIVPNKGRIIVNPNSECKFSKDNLLELTMGELITIVNKLKEEGEDFRVESPQAVLAPRGTKFITKVKKDGTTTLTVIDGEVEFLDKQMRKMVLVKKNQKSVVKPGGLPSEPVSFDPKMIPKWWE